MESYADISRIALSVTNVFIVYALYDQARTIWRTKSAKDFTWSLIAALLLNETCWLNYGITIKEWPIWIVSAANFPAIIWATVGFLKYGRGEKSEPQVKGSN